MLRFILGGAGHGKTTFARELLCEKSKEERKLILLVPDQFSFATEKAILAAAGPMDSAKINVWSFNRLADEVFREFGGVREKRLDETGKAILMSMAIRSCRDHLKVYGGASEKLTGLMVQTVDELKACLISPEDMMEISREARGGLQGKASDIGLIYSAYEAVTQQYIDPQDLLTRAGKLIRENGFFRDSLVALDGFESFNKQKMAILSSALTQADECWVSLCADSLHAGGSGIREPVNGTAAAISALARELGVKTANPVYLKEGKRFASAELALIEERLFAPAPLSVDVEPRDVQIFEGKTVYDEAEFAAATIRNMVEGGCRYGDFAVICRAPHKYYSVIGSAFEKWEVPCYFSEPRRLDHQPLVRLVISAFETVRKNFRTEELLTMLKSGLCPLDSGELSMLENYVFTWKITGAAWKAPFTKHPGGFGREWDEDSRAEIEKLNELRKRIVGPLLRFSQAEPVGEAVSEAVYRLLTDYGADQKTVSMSRAYKAGGHEELAADGPRVWQLLMDVLDKFVLITGNRPMNLDEYYGYLKEVLAGEEMRDIPLRLDTVTFGTADTIKQVAKAVFVMGAVQGEFPMVPTASGLFSDNERKSLMELRLPIEDRLEEKTMAERFYAYTAVCSASEKLFVTYHTAHGGDDLVPGELVDRLKALFPQIKVLKNPGSDYYLSTPGAAFSVLAREYRAQSPLGATLKAFFENNGDYAGRLEALERTAKGKEFHLGDRALSRALFGSNYLSASQIEAYHKCPFQYYCRYGLGAKERKPAELNVLEYGTLMHYLFEGIFSGDFKKYYRNEALLRSDIEEMIRRYADEKMGGMNAMNGRDKYRFRRMADTAVLLAAHMMEGLAAGDFTPAYFELALSEQSGFPPLKIKTASGETVRVGGIIDRVDVYDSPKGRYVRVVDYKTGVKEFKLMDVLYGLNLQMLIYLAALCQQGKALPAGVLYMPSFTPAVSPAKRVGPQEVKAQREKELRMNGVVLSDPQIIEAMENGAAGRFIPVGIKENGKLSGAESAYGAGDMEALFAHARNLVTTMADALLRGDIAASPLMVNGNSCAWCPYGSICREQRDDRLINRVKLPRDRILERMKVQHQ